MEAVEEPINWSAIACRAFALKLAEITTRQEVRQMGDVIARLRASKQQHEAVVYKRGVEAGQEWAKRRAEAAELTRLERLHTELRGDLSQAFHDSADSAYGSGELFFFTICPEDDGDREAASDFWEDHEESNDSEYVRGFADGALNVWSEIKDQL
jgi:hypothetical protein